MAAVALANPTTCVLHGDNRVVAVTHASRNGDSEMPRYGLGLTGGDKGIVLGANLAGGRPHTTESVEQADKQRDHRDRDGESSTEISQERAHDALLAHRRRAVGMAAETLAHAIRGMLLHQLRVIAVTHAPGDLDRERR